MVLTVLARQNVNMDIAFGANVDLAPLIAAIVIATAVNPALVVKPAVVMMVVAKIADFVKKSMAPIVFFLQSARAVIAFGALAGRPRFIAVIATVIVASRV